MAADDPLQLYEQLHCCSSVDAIHSIFELNVISFFLPARGCMTDNNLDHMRYIIRCVVGIGLVLFGITLMRGPADSSGIPVIIGFLVICAGALTLIISLLAWLFSAMKREDTIVDVPTRGRPADAAKPTPAPPQRTAWEIIRAIIYWWWRM